MPFKDVRHVGMVSNYTGNGIHCRGAYSYFPLTDPFGQIDPYTGQVKVWEVATSVGFYSSSDDGSQYSEIVLSPTNISISANEATLSNITVWSANSILTQSRADSRYIADSTVGNISTSYGNDLFYGQYQTRHASPGFPFVAGGLLTNSRGIVGVSNTTDPCNIEFHPGESFNQMRFRSYNKCIVINNEGFSVETGTANWTWSANSILTQGRGDVRYQANGSYLNDVLTNVTTSYGTDSVRGMQKGYGGPNFVAGKLFVGSVGMVGMVSGNETAGVEFMTGGVFNSIRIRQFAHTVILSNSGFEVETGTANWTWSDNSILTQGRGDSRYQNATNNTYANLPGTPTLATVATSGNYNDLSNKPASYTLPAATNSTLGGIIVGANLSVSANGTLSANIPAGGGGGFQNGDILNGGTY